LAAREGVEITVVDIGAELDGEHKAIFERLAALRPGQLPPELAPMGRSAAVRARRQLPEKRLFGSDFPFSDHGQLAGLDVDQGAGRALVSGAYGGFSTVWGAQVMPFSAASFGAWPVSAAEMTPHYRAICEHVPVAGEQDDLRALFPHPKPPVALPPLSPRTVMVLSNYARHRAKLRKLGITVGYARLALRASECVRCGLCMTGCPYSLIYSSAQTFDALRRAARVNYRSGLVVHKVGDDEAGAVVHARDMRSGRLVRLTADRVYLACGAVGTTRLVLGSLGLVGTEVEMAESAQFFFPSVSARPTPGPRDLHDFTLGQFNAVIDCGPGGGGGADLAQVQFYPYNPAVLRALPAPLQAPRAAPITAEVLSRLTIGLGYLPSWASPPLRARVTSLVPGRLPDLRLERGEWPEGPAMLAHVLRKLVRAAGMLDLWPIKAQVTVARGGMSYHFGGSFPHRARGASSSGLATDRLGRLPAWDRVHLVDGSVFPTVPATTFVLTLMANAHRIASESLVLADHEAAVVS
jgi:ferredoxin